MELRDRIEEILTIVKVCHDDDNVVSVASHRIVQITDRSNMMRIQKDIIACLERQNESLKLRIAQLRRQLKIENVEKKHSAEKQKL
jgi:uncharacterized protein YigA (DUF484 family)